MPSKVDVGKKIAAKAPNTASSTVLRLDAAEPGNPSIPDDTNHFRTLPLELRLTIWTLAAPLPSIINQRKSAVEGRRWFFERRGLVRGVPNILHICKESRTEYLVTGEKDETLEHRRKKHPVYKMYFRNRSPTSGGAFMSMDIDSLWAEWYHVSESVRQKYEFKRYHLSSEYTGIVELCNLRCRLGNSSKNLVFTSIASRSSRMLTSDVRILSDMFPALETLTILITEAEIEGFWGWPIIYNPEIAGQLDSTSFGFIQQTIIQEVSVLVQQLTYSKLAYPSTKFPALKFRFEEQFITNENV